MKIKATERWERAKIRLKKAKVELQLAKIEIDAARNELKNELFGILSEPLTSRELVVLGCMQRIMTNKEIASELNIEVRTVKFHIGNIFKKFGVTERSELL
jgi:DNA-binding NarL/FixJ family response regulator